MKKFLWLLLMVAAIPAKGEHWFVWFQAQSDSVREYDWDSIAFLKNNHTKVWMLYISPNKTGGNKSLVEIDCEQKRYRLLEYSQITFDSETDAANSKYEVDYSTEALGADDAIASIWEFGEEKKHWAEFDTSDYDNEEFEFFCLNKTLKANKKIGSTPSFIPDPPKGFKIIK